MADNLPINFPIPRDAVIASYDGSEVATGTQFITFYLMDILGAGTDTTVNVLTENIGYSDFGRTDFGGGSAIDIDFDLLINAPFAIEGDAVINIFVETSNTLLAAQTITATLYHVSVASAETIIGATVTKTLTLGTTGNPLANSYDVVSIKYNIPNTVFSIGEKLRLTIGGTDPTAGKTVQILHDPKDRVIGTAATHLASNSNIFLPVDIK